MQKFWHISFLVLIALIWKVRPANASIDVCDLSNSNVSMFCSCEHFHRDKLGITCYVMGPMTPSSQVWAYFREQENSVALSMYARQSSFLPFVPVRAIQSLPSLETMTIQEASLNVLATGSFSEMFNLQNLKLASNMIQKMDRYSISNLPKLKKLSLSDNMLTELLADSLIGLDDLEELYLDRNNISYIEECAFCNLHNLKELELWRNNIEELNEKTFLGLRYVRRLDLSSNQLRILLDKVFSTLPKLLELDLGNNFIERISPMAFEGLEHLSTLRFRNNYLKTLPDDVFKPTPMLVSLDLTLNKLETIQEELFSHLSASTTSHFSFMFQNNLLKCGCGMWWVHKWVTKVSETRFGKELLSTKCTMSDSGEEYLVHELKLRPCEKPQKKAKVVQEATTSTVSHKTEGTSLKDDWMFFERNNEVRTPEEPATIKPLSSQSGSPGSLMTPQIVLMIFTLVFVILTRTLMLSPQ